MKKILLLSAVLLAFAGCKKDKEDEAKPTPTPKPQAFYSDVTVDGVPLSFTAGKNGYIANPYRYDVPGADKSLFSCTIIDTNAFTDYFSVGLRYLYFTGPKPDETIFKNFFSAGARTYAQGSDDDGAFISYYNEVADEYYVSNKDVQPISSYFNITSRSSRKAGDKNYVDVKGEFKCVVYEILGSSPSKTLAGKFYCTFADVE